MPGYIEQALLFGPFTLHRARRLLLEGEKEVRLGEKTLDLLIVLSERAGEVVSKQELIAFIWPAGGVEETTLRAHIVALRTVLGEGHGGYRYIVNVPGRGYCFVATVERPRLTADSSKPAVRPEAGEHNLPIQLTRVIGRDQICATVVEQLPRRRFISLVGSAGMGKSAVALEVAERMLTQYSGGIRFVDLSLLSDPLLVPSAVGAALEARLPTVEPVSSLVRFLFDKSMLLILDSCEHVADAAVEVAVSILKGAPAVHVLTTSREPLRAEGEWVQRLPPLGFPPAGSTLSAADALQYPAVALFVERAIASVDSYVLTDVDAPLVAEICRRIDGMPLAIELAAARMPALGVRGLVRSLDDRLRALSSRQRTGLPRHRTLSALLDWSHQMLPERERIALRRLSAFRGGFTLQSALAIAVAEGQDARLFKESVVSLASKSLISSEVGDKEVHYRLLETTRAYAFQKLVESGELGNIQRRHAALMCDIIGASGLIEITLAGEPWAASRARHVDDIRAALDWAFAPGGDAQIGVRLTTSAIPLSTQLVLLDEFRERVDAARRYISGLERAEPLLEMRLNIAFLALSAQTIGPNPDMDAAADRAIELAEEPALEPHRAEAMNAGWSCAWGNGRYERSLHFAHLLLARARSMGDPVGALAADRMTAQSLHFMGHQDEARVLAERVINHPTRVIRLGAMQPIALDRRVSMRIILARLHWIQGRVEQAVQVANECVELAADDMGYGYCQALALAACPIALWVDDRDMANTYIWRLQEKARKLNLNYWERWAANFSAVLSGRDDPLGNRSLTPLHLRIDEHDHKQWDVFGTFGIAYDHVPSFERAEDGECGWCAAEIFRSRGAWLLLQDEANGDAAQRLFETSAAIARKQRALSWELRTALSLSRLWRDRGRIKEAKLALSSVYDQFTEGFDSSDLRAAKTLLAQFDPAH